MSQKIFISTDGTFEIDSREYRIPGHFSTREVLSYRSLMAPIPDKPRGTTLSAEQRFAAEAFFYRRAADCVIPEFGANAPDSLSRDELWSIHRWISRHRPALSARPRTERP